MYQVVIAKSVQRQINKLPPPISERALRRIAELAENPRPSDIKKLKGRDAYRIRIGDYRLIYEIHDKQLTIILIEIGHRHDIYR